MYEYLWVGTSIIEIISSYLNDSKYKHSQIWPRHNIEYDAFQKSVSEKWLYEGGKREVSLVWEGRCSTMIFHKLKCWWSDDDDDSIHKAKKLTMALVKYILLTLILPLSGTYLPSKNVIIWLHLLRFSMTIVSQNRVTYLPKFTYLPTKNVIYFWIFNAYREQKNYNNVIKSIHD